MLGYNFKRQLSETETHNLKSVAAKASSSVVHIVARNVPVEACKTFRDYCVKVGEPPKEALFFGSGTVIECEKSSSHYDCTILAPASLFKRTEDVPLNEIEIEVYLSTGCVHKATVLGCDFHYNLAAISIMSHSPLPPIYFRPIDDIISIDPKRYINLSSPRPHRPTSQPFQVDFNTLILSVFRTSSNPKDSIPCCGTLCLSSPKEFSCNELYEIKDDTFLGDGAPAFNAFGDAIGIIFGNSAILPSNLVTRWWSNFKSCGSFCHPVLGMEVANLHEADLDFLAKFTARFPGVFTGVVVTKVEEDSPAYLSGFSVDDVIVKLHGHPIESKMKFYEAIWDDAGSVVSLMLLRLVDAAVVNVSLMIEETSSHKYHEWPHPRWDWVK